MIALWYAEAGKYDVFPIDARGTMRLADVKPQLALPRKLYVYYPHTSVVSNMIAPRITNRRHAITATVDLKNGADGVLVAQGSASGGYVLYLKDTASARLQLPQAPALPLASAPRRRREA
jgi:arylsulfatase